MHPVALLALGSGVLIASGFGTFYSILAVGVSDGSGHVTAQLMLGGCIIVGLGALTMVWRAILALSEHL
jgi:hypothetical protein